MRIFKTEYEFLLHFMFFHGKFCHILSSSQFLPTVMSRSSEKDRHLSVNIKN